MTRLPNTIFGATLTLALAAAFADAQTTPKQAPPPETGGHGKMGCMMGEHAEGMHKLADLANIKADNTKFGATIQLSAKNAADVAKVQELARNLATELAKPHGHPKHGH
jgi:hypothetical protein